MKGSESMVRAVDIKYKPTGPLADMIGGKATTRGQIVKALWKFVKKNNLQGESGTGKKVKVTSGKMESLGRVIYAEDDDAMYEMVGNKKLVTMFEMTKRMEKYLDRQN
jgi:chromatin remodeling complex protein RSC6